MENIIIKRENGNIEITPTEAFFVYRKIEKEYQLEDFNSKYVLPKNKEKREKLQSRFEHCLGNNDSYWESYWATVDMVAKEFKLKERNEAI